MFGGSTSDKIDRMAVAGTIKLSANPTSASHLGRLGLPFVSGVRLKVPYLEALTLLGGTKLDPDLVY